METLVPPDSLYLESAKGWYLLGNLKEADLELNQIAPVYRRHPDVLEIRFYIYARSRKWGDCMEIATAMLEVAPDRPDAWVNSTIVLHALNETQAAWKTLHRVMARFPSVPFIPYYLACYACVLGRYNDSTELLKQAIRLGGHDFRTMAREDPDLKPRWHRIEQLT